MQYVFELYKTDVELAKQEVLALIPTHNYKLYNNFLSLNTSTKKIATVKDRLAYTKKIYQQVCECSQKNILKELEKVPWKSLYKKNFSVRIESVDKKKIITEKQVAKIIWNNVKSPKVQLKNADTQIVIHLLKKKALCSLQLFEQRDSFELRRSHLRPRPSPISLHPKLARAMVNLTSAKKSDMIVDPFCGSGGILIEAGLMGMSVKGFDINQKMIWKSMVNLVYYKIKAKLKTRDFFENQSKHKYVVTDFPYGLNASINKTIRVTKQNRKKQVKELEQFYEKIVQHLNSVVKKRAVVIFPSYANYRKLLKKTELNIIHEFDNFIHNNLTRKIVVLEKKA